MVGAYSFYLDPTHLHPIPPDTLKFVAEARGFSNVRILRLHRRNEQASTINDPIHELLERMDMEQDYAIIGYKK
jgi:O-antigen chain-terminating methyltransferase